MDIKGITKVVSIDEIKKAIETGKSVTGIVAIEPLQLLNKTYDMYLDMLEEMAFEGCYIERDDFEETLIDFNKEHGALIYTVTIHPIGIEE